MTFQAPAPARLSCIESMLSGCTPGYAAITVASLHLSSWLIRNAERSPSPKQPTVAQGAGLSRLGRFRLAVVTDIARMVTFSHRPLPRGVAQSSSHQQRPSYAPRVRERRPRSHPRGSSASAAYVMHEQQRKRWLDRILAEKSLLE